jgi:hypothetical protein
MTDQPVVIHGIVSQSKYENNFAASLEKYEWQYDYQIPLFGGRNVVGGTVLDFLVYTVPLPTPVYIDAEYWHSGTRSEKDKVLEAMIAARLRKYYQMPRRFGDAEVGTPEAADRTVLREFGRMG